MLSQRPYGKPLPKPLTSNHACIWFNLVSIILCVSRYQKIPIVIISHIYAFYVCLILFTFCFLCYRYICITALSYLYLGCTLIRIVGNYKHGCSEKLPAPGWRKPYNIFIKKVINKVLEIIEYGRNLVRKINSIWVVKIFIHTLGLSYSTIIFINIYLKQILKGRTSVPLFCYACVGDMCETKTKCCIYVILLVYY